ncbi:hypothetical protein BMS3Abin07_01700 [bacterium BMS3Abin07]|nr:hypothetical protein BMS3Abin07_01700 [bacterium BMS3Abin07]GBE33335.1 hypothetical protein BMS3Bbin05_02276 [bacterium BMS3Bbin05]HDO22238.1 hypothetical protein [Nitrospirota bacterium]
MIGLYLDEDVHKKIAVALRLKGYDVVSVHEVQKYSLSDYQQLEYAITEERAIFTFNAGDFNILHKEYMYSERSHFGIIVSSRCQLVNLSNA